MKYWKSILGAVLVASPGPSLGGFAPGEPKLFNQLQPGPLRGWHLARSDARNRERGNLYRVWIENRLLTSKTDHLRRLLTLYNEYPVPLEVDTGSLRLLVGRFFHSIQWLASSRVGGMSLREFPFRCFLCLTRHGEHTSGGNFRSRGSAPGSRRRGSPLAKNREGRSRRGG